MTLRGAVRLRRDRRAVVALEFAVAVMPLVLLIVGIVESGLMFWSWQALQATAIDAARCAAINALSCQNAATTPANTQSYAATEAVGRGLTGVTSSNVTVLSGTAAQSACGATTASVISVKLTYQYAPVVLVPLSSGLTAAACFPLAAS
jgi:Flp pilus assembly protein TadG